MDIKIPTFEEILEKHRAESSDNDKEDGIFYLKDNVDIEVMEHGDLYEDQDKKEVRYAVCCPECGEVVFLDSGSRTSEKHGDPNSDIFSSEKITYNLACSSCECSFKATEHTKNIAWSIIFLVCVPAVMLFLSFLFTLIGKIIKQEKITLVSGIVFACCALWFIALSILAHIFGNKNDE